MSGTETVLILAGWALMAGSPGPATLSLAGTAMQGGRGAGLTLAAGVLTGSATWGLAAALGLSAVMMANVWLFEVVRYAGAAYLSFLALKSLRSALSAKGGLAAKVVSGSRARIFRRGLFIHLTNPKAVLAWGSIYAIVLPSGAAPGEVWVWFAMLVGTSASVFLLYSLLFSTRKALQVYTGLRRWFESVFALLFGAAAVKILTAQLT